jgi:chromosomal replication initiation ATPase DnaA
MTLYDVTPFVRERNIPSRVAHIIFETAQEHRQAVCDVLGDTRIRAVYYARSEAMRRVRNMTTLCGRRPSLPQIGKWFDRDHTSVLYAIRGAERRL